jgi:hypothetical protein
MCNIGEALSRAFTPAGTGALEAQLAGQQQAATNAAATATDALTAAIKQTTQAAVPVADNPSARAASLTEMQRIMAAQGNTWSFGNTPTAMPLVATKQLMGA